MRRTLRIIRNIFLAPIAAIIALGGVFAFNVFSHSSRQLQVATIPKTQVDGEDLKRFHGTNERLSIEGYADMIRFYRRLMENAAG
jgi:acetylornithine deacetylase/succinyl-diaminopimelate desuccinylase-like protein